MFNNDFLVMEFGYNYLKLIVAAKDNKGVKIKRMDIIPTIIGSMSDGNVINVDQVVGRISNHLITNDIKTKKAIVVITNPSIMIREAKVLNHKKAIINSFIQIEAKNHFPIDITDCVVDYKIIPNKDSNAKDEKKEYKIMMASIPRAIIEKYITVINMLGLKVKSIDIASDCIPYLYSRKKKLENEKNNNDIDNAKNEKTSAAFIDIGAEITNITIAVNGQFKYNKILNFGASYLTHAISLDKSIKDKLVDSERKKRNIYFDYITEDGDNNDLDESDGFKPNRTIKVIMRDLLENIDTFFSFHESRKTGNSIDEIILVGGGAYQKGMKEIFIDYYDKDVTLGFDFDGVSFDEVAKRNMDKLLYFYNCIGAGLKV